MVRSVDAVFKALSDPTRRQLLDTLRDKGGLTLTELEQGLGMTRFGVMKHLKVLEEAHLVVSRRDGRFKYHYLNALPIQELADRWMAPYAKPLARFALNIKNALEDAPQMIDKADFVLATYIRTTPAELWDAIVNPAKTSQYYYGGRVQAADLKVGGRFYYLNPDGEMNLDGEIIEIDPPRKLVTTFKAIWAPPEAKVTRVMYEIEQMGETCRLTLTHYDAASAMAGAETGWPLVLSGLKTFLETGRPLNVPMTE
ncbi:MAG: metalloregulator ArsR/SmtB family transcription factor [Devosia sp.]